MAGRLDRVALCVELLGVRVGFLAERLLGELLTLFDHGLDLLHALHVRIVGGGFLGAEVTLGGGDGFNSLAGFLL